jgi:peptidyl-prolyl cis-trans isomerase D
MATLQRIRDRAGLLIAVIIGLALLAFVLGDLLGRGGRGGTLFSNSQYEIAEISGKSIPYRDYLKSVDNMASIYKFTLGRNNLDETFMDNIRTDVWEKMVQDFVMEKEYKELGLAVSGDELFDMFQGSNPHPLIRQIFTNPETGVINRSQLFRFLQETQEDNNIEEKRFRIYLENEILRYTIFSKYNNLIRKGLNVTSLEAARRIEESNRTVDLDFIVQRFNTVPDSVITVNEKDIEDYYKIHKADFEQEESRDIRYVYFEVVPSEDDYKAAEKWINDIKPEFVNTENTRQFVLNNSDIRYDDNNYSYDSLPDRFKDSLFNAEIGTIIGPYFEDNAYKLSKLAEVNYLPDSVRARHILLQANQNNARQMLQLADSLKELIEDKRADFAELARTNSADGSAQEGGDLGWFTESDMVNVKQLSDSCFFGDVGDIKLISSQFGIHIVEILEQSRKVKKVQIGTVARIVEPSEATERYYYSKAGEFAGLNNTYDKFNKAIEEQDLIPRFATNLDPLEKNITDLESPRALVKWAYNNDEHAVSGVFKLGNKYVIAAIDKVREEGYAPIEDVQAEIEIEVKKEKKAQYIIDNMKSKLAGINSLEELANELDTRVQTATNIRFTSNSLAGAGIEPNVISAASSLDMDVVSDPITGNNGVYVITITNINVPAEPGNEEISREKQFIERNYNTRVYYSAYEILKEMAKIQDQRTKFF